MDQKQWVEKQTFGCKRANHYDSSSERVCKEQEKIETFGPGGVDVDDPE